MARIHGHLRASDLPNDTTTRHAILLISVYLLTCRATVANAQELRTAQEAQARAHQAAAQQKAILMAAPSGPRMLEPLPPSNPDDPAFTGLIIELRGMEGTEEAFTSKLEELRNRLELEFSARHDIHAKVISETEKQLESIKNLHQQRARNRDTIVQRRIDELLGRTDALQWEIHPAPIIPSGSNLGPADVIEREAATLAPPLFDPTHDPASTHGDSSSTLVARLFDLARRLSASRAAVEVAQTKVKEYERSVEANFNQGTIPTDQLRKAQMERNSARRLRDEAAANLEQLMGAIELIKSREDGVADEAKSPIGLESETDGIKDQPTERDPAGPHSDDPF